MKNRIVQIACAAVVGMGLVAYGETVSNETALVIRDKNLELRFLEVKGESKLPLTFMNTGEDREKVESVTLPRYWIAERPVTEGEYASVMADAPIEELDANAPAANMMWIQAFYFCNAFNKKYRDQLPKGYILSLPTIVEWAHAARCLDGKAKFRGAVGTFLFSAAIKHGVLTTFSDSAEAPGLEGRIDFAIDYAAVPKYFYSTAVGIRPVLIPADMTYLGENAWVMRAGILRYNNFKRGIEPLLAQIRGAGTLPEEKLTQLFKEYMDFAREPAGEYIYDDWSGMITFSEPYLKHKGYEVSPYMDLWRFINWYPEHANDTGIGEVYREVGIVGTFKRVDELPPAARPSAMALESYASDGADTNQLQVLECDFTGDKRVDLVVEACSVGAKGYWYDFFQQKPDGSYTNVLSLQTVGLCALPRKKGGPVGFYVVEKTGNPMLNASLLSFDIAGEASLRPIFDRDFYMIDAEKDRIYSAAPFIGAGYGLGWKFLSKKGIWYRPLYWPWKAGKVPEKFKTSEQK